MRGMAKFSRHILLTIFLCGINSTAYALLQVQGEKFSQCKAVFASNGDSSLPMSMRSTLDCVRTCSHEKGCVGVTSCRSSFPGERVRCWLSEAMQRDTMCSKDETHSSQSSESCFYFQKIQHTEGDSTAAMSKTTPLQGGTTSSTPDVKTQSSPQICQNGGTFSSSTSQCLCLAQFGGFWCQRYIRDCSEAFANGYTSVDFSGVYYIQPALAPNPFPVLCDLREGGITHPFRRNQFSFFNKDWRSCKSGFEGDPWGATDPCFFIGLENLYYLLQQGEYDMYLYIWYLDASYSSIRYEHFEVGPEVLGFPVTYDQFENKDPVNSLANMFPNSTPVIFSANGNDVNGCFFRNKMAGWYGADCSGHSLFCSGQCPYPVNGQYIETDVILMNLIRKNPTRFTE